MTDRIPHRRDSIEHYVRREHARRRVGVDSQCACGESRPQALIAGSDPITCLNCARKSKGRTHVDLHHVAGRANDPLTIPVPANDHVADLSERQRDWPRETLENVHGSPVLRAAARVRGFRDTLHYLDRTLLGAAELLEGADAWLVAKFGVKWFLGTPLERFAPRRKGNGDAY